MKAKELTFDVTIDRILIVRKKLNNIIFIKLNWIKNIKSIKTIFAMNASGKYFNWIEYDEKIYCHWI